MPISRLWPCLLALMITGCPEPDPSDPDPGTAGADTLDTTDATDTTGADSAPECTSAADCSDTVDTGPCTATVCIDQKCALAPAIGEPCDDGDPCTDKDLCNAESECVGTGYSCEQPDTCLTSACDGSGGCTVTQHEGTCLIEGVCYEEGDTAPDALCLSCSPDTNASEWTAATPSTPCEDDDGCTLDDACTGDGVCVGAWDSTSCGCDSDAECSHLTGACAEGKCLASEHVCVSLPVPGGACDDGDSCTEDDLCDELGGCQGTAYVCEPASGCHASLCDGEGGCGESVLPGSCFIGGACWGAGAADPGAPCGACQPEVDAEAWTIGPDASCDDGEACTSADTCVSVGECEGTAYACAAPSECEAAACDGAGGCAIAVQPGWCQIDGLCATEGTVSADGCSNCEPETDPNAWTPLVGTACDDGDACTMADSCTDSGGCEGTTYACAPSAICQFASCDGAGGCEEVLIDGFCLIDGVCHVAGTGSEGGGCETCKPESSTTGWTLVEAGSPCNDGEVCTLTDACTEDGQCKGAWDEDNCGCDADSDCTALTDACNVGICLLDVNLCAAVPQLANSCDDGNPCTHSDACGATGKCDGKPYACVSGASCELSTCDGEGGCNTSIKSGTCLIEGECFGVGASNIVCSVCKPNVSQTEWTDPGNACDDLSDCTKNDVCTGLGECAGTPYSCTANEECQSATCDGDGGCTLTTKGNTCLIGGVCYGADAPMPGGDGCGVCAPNQDQTAWSIPTKPCDDGNACSAADKCLALGLCLGTDYSCSASGSCLSAACDGDGGCTESLKPETCIVDGLCFDKGATSPDAPCSVCDPEASTSTLTGLAAGAPCDDGEACTLDDSCSESGSCLGAWDAAGCGCVDDSTCTFLTGTCTKGTCDPVNHICYAAPTVGGACDDGDPCTHGDTCADAGCQGTAYTCPEGSACEVPACDGQGGCVDSIAQGTCLIDGACHEAGDPGGPCLACDPSASQEAWSQPTSASCDDGQPCTANDTCLGVGECVGDPFVCKASEPCLAATCNGSGCDEGPAAVGAACDGDACAAEASCQEQVFSASTCGELGWNATQYGAPTVCGESEIVPAGGGTFECTGTVPWEQAKAACEVVGARLCTADEMAADETRGTGCGYDDDRLWTATLCEGGALTQAGSTKHLGKHPAQCTNLSAPGVVTRCCADTSIPTSGMACVTTLAETCDDGDPCTADSCDPKTGCKSVIVAGGACEDGDGCTFDDLCGEDGSCTGTPFSCEVPPCATGVSCDGEGGCQGVGLNDGFCYASGECLADGTAPDGVVGARCFADTAPNALMHRALFEDFSSLGPGWTLDGEWEIGPTGASVGSQLGSADPTLDHSPGNDNAVAAAVLAGTVSTTAHPGYFLTSPTVDTGSASQVVLSYWRWLNSDGAPDMTNSVEVYDGEGWQVVWDTDGGAPQDAGWAHHVLDISAHANPALQVRFGYAVGDGGALAVAGWNVDDVTILTDACSGDSECDDGDPCNGSEGCSEGVCTAGDPSSVCSVGGTCYAEGANPQNPAQHCLPDTNPESLLYRRFFEDFADNAAGWTLDTDWAIGSAAASSGEKYGNPDPAMDHTDTDDNGVAGVALGANVPVKTHDYYYLTSPPVDVSDASVVQLQFWRWLNSDYTPYMQNRVQVFDGAAWKTLWETGKEPGVRDVGWTTVSYDLSAHKNAALQVRIGFKIGNKSAFKVSGWNVDDLAILTDTCGSDGDCGDGDACNGGETCAGGVCSGGGLSLGCQWGGVCTLDGQPSSLNPGMVCLKDIDSTKLIPSKLGDGFAANTGAWTLEGDWAIGATSASSGGLGNGDPALDHSPTDDNGVAGVVLGGNVPKTVTDFLYLESPAVDAAGAAGAYLMYWRWLNSDFAPWMTNRVEIWNGAAWVVLWETGGSPPLKDAGWTLVWHDVSAYANADLKARFGYAVGKPDVFFYSGWNLDDIHLLVERCTAASDCPASACETPVCVDGKCAYTGLAPGDSCDDGDPCSAASECQPPAMSAKACTGSSGLGWTNATSWGSALVCGSTEVLVGGKLGCSGEHEWGQAKAKCEELGARLCTYAELTAQETRGTGCGYDGDLCWSSTPCPGGYLLQLGASGTKATAVCAAPDTTDFHRVRCCADVDLIVDGPTCQPLSVDLAGCGE